jgi:hypothetical protein
VEDKAVGVVAAETCGAQVLRVAGAAAVHSGLFVSEGLL